MRVNNWGAVMMLFILTVFPLGIFGIVMSEVSPFFYLLAAPLAVIIVGAIVVAWATLLREAWKDAWKQIE